LNHPFTVHNQSFLVYPKQKINFIEEVDVYDTKL